MGTGSLIYRIVLLLHIGSAIIGFGGLMAHGAYNAKAFRSSTGQARVLLQATQSVAKTAHYALYALLALGVVLISISDKAFGFGDPWVSASFVVWFVLIGLIHGLVRPTIAKLNDRADSLIADAGPNPPATMADDETATAIARRLALAETGVHLLLVVGLALMIWKPGA